MCFYSRQTKKAVELINRYKARIVNELQFEAGQRVQRLFIPENAGHHQQRQDCHRPSALGDSSRFGQKTTASVNTH